MIEKLVQSLHESVKKRNTADSYITDSPGDNVIHRGYIRNATLPIKYEFLPAEEQKSKNEGKHIYRFGSGKSMGVIIVNHKMNKKQDTGHETTSTINYETDGFENNVDLQRILVPAIMHHFQSLDPDIINFNGGFRYTKELMSRIDPKGEKFTVTKKESGLTLKKSKPLDAKAMRVVNHIKKTINTKRRR
jgi:hypothetical protein